MHKEDWLISYKTTFVGSVGKRWKFLFTKLDVEERERERGSNLRWQRLASPTAQVLVALTTQPVQKNWLHDEL